MASHLETLCREARRVVEATGHFIIGEMGKVRAQQIEEKSLNSLVSYVDRQAEQQLVEGLGRLVPGAVFLTEEATVEQGRGHLSWIIDPLDGTTNFLHQVPVFSVSVALREREQTLLGLVYEINRRECFFGWRGGGVFCNDQRVEVSRAPRLSDALLATGFPYYDYERMGPYLRVLEAFMRNTRGIRRLGSAAVDLAYVAAGRFDAFFEYSLNPWDVAAGAFLVEEAAGRVGDFRGGSDFLFGGELIAANPVLFEAVLSPLRAAFYPG